MNGICSHGIVWKESILICVSITGCFEKLFLSELAGIFHEADLARDDKGQDTTSGRWSTTPAHPVENFRMIFETDF